VGAKLDFHVDFQWVNGWTQRKQKVMLHPTTLNTSLIV